MSRSLGSMKTRAKLTGNENSPEALGRAAFLRGDPETANPWYSDRNDKGKGHAWQRGFRRARMEKHGA